MSSPSIHNAGSASSPSSIQPADSGADKAATGGRFNDRDVTIVTSSESDLQSENPNSAAFWNEGGFGKYLENYDAQTTLRSAAEEAQKGGLLQFLRKTVRAIINFFTRNPDAPTQSTNSGSAHNLKPQSADIKTMVVHNLLTDLTDAGSRISNEVKKLANLGESSTFKTMKQMAQRLNLPNREDVATIANKENVQRITEGLSPQTTEDFQTAANMLQKVYDAEIKLADRENGTSFGQIVENVQKPHIMAPLLDHENDRMLRNWMTHALNSIEQCSQVMKDAASGQTIDPARLEKIGRDVREFTSKPADKLPRMLHS